MNREQFEHVIAAAANIIDLDEFVVIGSQAVLGTVAAAPDSMIVSMEADLYPLAEPDRAAEVDGAIGDGSQFQRTFGYYAHGVGPETAKLPRGWAGRRIRVDIPPRPGSKREPVAYCPEIHDLVLSKLAAGRDRDIDYGREAQSPRARQPRDPERASRCPAGQQSRPGPSHQPHREPVVGPGSVSVIRSLRGWRSSGCWTTLRMDLRSALAQWIWL